MVPVRMSVRPRRKETADVNNPGCKLGYLFVLTLVFVLSLWGGAPAVASDADSECSSVVAKWEQLVQDIKAKLDDYRAVQHTPVDRITQRPLVEPNTDKPIARQISQALQVKENILIAKRKECRDLLNVENDLFTQVTRCLDADHSSKRANAKRLAKQRSTVVQSAITLLAEVREVEGKEYYPQYVDSWRNQNGGFRGVRQGGYWGEYPSY
jgi:hypothetical protein